MLQPDELPATVPVTPTTPAPAQTPLPAVTPTNTGGNGNIAPAVHQSPGGGIRNPGIINHTYPADYSFGDAIGGVRSFLDNLHDLYD